MSSYEIADYDNVKQEKTVLCKYLKEYCIK